MRDWFRVVTERPRAAPLPGSTVMWVCQQCKFEIPLDDVMLRSSNSDRCICVACYRTITATTKPMAKALRRQIQQSSNDAP